MESGKMGHIFLLTLLCCLLTGGCFAAEELDANLVISRASREVDLVSSVVKQSVTFSFQNSGSGQVSSFLYVVDTNVAPHLAYIGAETKSSGGKDSSQLTVQSTKIKSQPDLTAYKVSFASALGPGQSANVIVKTVFTHVISPYPKEISQMEKQLVQYTTSAYINTPYICSTQNSDFTLPSSNIESHGRVSPVSVDGSTISYGPYTNLPPYSNARITIHYENNGPFLGVVTLDRLIQVSHWGVIQVEEQIHIRHTGAVLKGSFSRYDYQRNPNSGPSSVKSYKSLLPAAAQDVYYRDEIGNISTSHLREDEDFVELMLRPRFPLFGGWQTRYTIGYNIPSYENLYNSGNNFVLKMRFVDHIFDDQVIDKVTTRIILPEGSKNIDLKTPFPVRKEEESRHYTYLDVVGRPVVTARANNLVEEHIGDFELHYQFESYLLLQEPLLLVGGLLLFFSFIIFVVRLDFTISKDGALVSQEQQSHAKDLISKTTGRQFTIIKRIQSSIDSYKKTKDSKQFKSSTKDFLQSYQDLLAELRGHFDLIRDTDSSKILRKVQEMRSTVEHLIKVAEQVVSGGMKTEAYIKESESGKKKLANLQEEVERMVQRL